MDTSGPGQALGDDVFPRGGVYASEWEALVASHGEHRNPVPFRHPPMGRLGNLFRTHDTHSGGAISSHNPMYARGFPKTHVRPDATETEPGKVVFHLLGLFKVFLKTIEDTSFARGATRLVSSGTPRVRMTLGLPLAPLELTFYSYLPEGVTK